MALLSVHSRCWQIGLAEWPDYVWTRATASHDFFEDAIPLTVNFCFSANIEMRSAMMLEWSIISPLRVWIRQGIQRSVHCFGTCSVRIA